MFTQDNYAMEKGKKETIRSWTKYVNNTESCFNSENNCCYFNIVNTYIKFLQKLQKKKEKKKITLLKITATFFFSIFV